MVPCPVGGSLTGGRQERVGVEYEEPEIRDYGRLSESLDSSDTENMTAVPAEELAELLAEPVA